MGITVGQIVAEAIERYSGIRGMNNSTIAMTLDKAQQELYQFIGKVSTKEIKVTTKETKHVGSDYRCDNLIKAYYYDRTGLNDGDITPVGTDFIEVTDVESLKDLDNPSYVKLTPKTDSRYNVITLFYRAIPTPISTDESKWGVTFIEIDDEYSNLLLFKLIKTIATFGDIPDVSIANNYQREYDSLFAKAKADFYRRRARNRPNKIKHSDIW